MDFVAAYGVALVILAFAFAVIYDIGLPSNSLTSPQCTASPGFTCTNYTLDTTGLLTLTLSQATGSPIQINGASCSSGINATGNAPTYGNVYIANTVGFYPFGNDPYGATISSDGSKVLRLYCYSAKGPPAAGQLAQAFKGYIWLNYTVVGYGQQVQQIASMTVVYS